MIVKAKPCPGCGYAAELQVQSDDYARWKSGVLIQKAFPYLSIDDRERLVTGYCSPCWDDIFGDDDDESLDE